jgi:hypothetical protein
MDASVVAAVTGLALGVALAAACGFRVFVPPLIVGIAARAGWLDLSSNWGWLGGTPALVVFGTATVLEIAAYYVPWLDNLLDSIASPSAVVAGIVVTAAVTGDMPGFLRWPLSVIAGGGAAAVVQLMTTGARAFSSAATGGVANPVVSTIEAAMSVLLSILALLLPLVAGVVTLVLIFFAGRFLYRRLRPKTVHSTPAEFDKTSDL